MIKLTAFRASGWARMKLSLAGTVNRLNIEHRTSNIDDATLYRYKTGKPQPAMSPWL
jgi:hypothetical protein